MAEAMASTDSPEVHHAIGLPKTERVYARRANFLQGAGAAIQLGVGHGHSPRYRSPWNQRQHVWSDQQPILAESPSFPQRAKSSPSIVKTLIRMQSSLT